MFGKKSQALAPGQNAAGAAEVARFFADEGSLAKVAVLYTHSPAPPLRLQPSFARVRRVRLVRGEGHGVSD